jgi:galacturan 1,4-alpha-galacturonidase
MLRSLALAALAAPALAAIIPSPAEIFSSVDRILHPDSGVSLLEIEPGYYDATTGRSRKLCILHPLGEERDDYDNLMKAVEECGNGGIIRLPDAN